jgi:hypothetical protein
MSTRVRILLDCIEHHCPRPVRAQEGNFEKSCPHHCVAHHDVMFKDAPLTVGRILMVARLDAEWFQHRERSRSIHPGSR